MGGPGGVRAARFQRCPGGGAAAPVRGAGRAHVTGGRWPPRPINARDLGVPALPWFRRLPPPRGSGRASPALARSGWRPGPAMALSGRRDAPEPPDFGILKRLARDQLVYLLEQVRGRPGRGSRRGAGGGGREGPGAGSRGCWPMPPCPQLPGTKDLFIEADLMSPLDRIANVSILKVPGCAGAAPLPAQPAPAGCCCHARPVPAGARRGQAVQGAEPAGARSQ